jgi:Ca2+-binding RTX toxin-like protein
VFGGGGNALYGGKGDDHLYGGPDNDVLVGGPGHDVFDCGEGVDRVVDFDAKEDTASSNCEILGQK